MEAVQTPLSCPLPGDGAVVDVAYNSTGDRMASCSDAGVVQVWGATPGSAGAWTLLHRHQMPPGQQPLKVAWSDPEYGSVVVVGTSNGAVHVLQGPSISSNEWQLAGSVKCGRGAVHSLAFAPRQHGLLLAVAGGDGNVWLHEGARQASRGTLTWTLLSKIQADCVGALCWRPFTSGLPPLLLTSSNHGAAIWCYDSGCMSWQRVGSLDAPGKATPAAALHWAPTLGRPHELAAAAFGSEVVLFKITGSTINLRGAPIATLRHPEDVWRVEFNQMGMTLACSLASNPEVWFWVPELTGAWRAVSRITGSTQQPGMVVE